jgi:cellulose biosynthesis protein BcsQ
MATIAVYNLKGGVGKTTLAVNLAWASAALSARRTLLWDLDAQGGASYILGGQGKARDAAQAIFSKDVDAELLIRPTAWPPLDVLPADFSLRGLDRLLADLGKRKRLAKLLDRLGKRYDRIILDCPPGLGEITEQVIVGADVIIVPVIPSALSQRALDIVVTFIDRQPGRRAPILPVHMMVDRRRALHRAGIEAHPDWPQIPMASAIEQMATLRAPIGAFASRSPAAEAFATLWRGIERRLAKG